MLARIKEKFEQIVGDTGLLNNKDLGISERSMEDIILEQHDYPKDISTLFCYRSFDYTKELFFNEDNNVGFVVEIAPLVGINDSVVRSLEHFLDDELPDRTFIQFLLVGGHKVGSILDNWERARISKNPNVQKITDSKKKFLSSMALDYRKSVNRVVRETKIIISCNWHGNDINKILDFKEQIINKLQTLQLQPYVYGVNDLLGLTDEILYYRKDVNQNAIKYNPLMHISEQIVQSGFECTVHENKLEMAEGMITKCFEVTEYPSKWSLASMISLLGTDHFAETKNIPARFVISYTVASDVSKSRSEAIASKGKSVQESAEQWYARHQLNLRKEAEEWTTVIARIEKQRILSECFQVMITADKQMISVAESALVSMYNDNMWRLKVNNTLQLPAMASMLPMQASRFWSAFGTFRLKKLALCDEAVAKIPIYGEWRGVPMPGMLLTARRGQLFNLNPYYRIGDGNYNMCVFAPTGGGKSVFLQVLAESMYAMNTKIFIMDIGGSYKKLCEDYGGDFIKFDASAGISLNPFGALASTGITPGTLLEDGTLAEITVVGDYHILTEGFEYAKSIVGSMCGINNDLHRMALLEELMLQAVGKYGPNLNITKIAEVLADHGSPEASKMSQTLFPFSSKGLYGKYFDRDSNIDFNNQLTVFEFQEIQKNAALVGVIVQIVSMQIFLKIQCGDRKQKFMLIVDEAWCILDYSDKFLADLTRNIRRYGGSVVTCVQNYSDFQGTEHRGTILKNSAWNIVLPQNAEGITAFKGTHYEDYLGLIKSLKLKPGKYSEMLISATGLKVVGKLALDYYSQALFSTDSDDHDFVTECLSSGVTLSEAMDSLAHKKEVADNLRS
jgi:type-IV secretion system protein TraC